MRAAIEVELDDYIMAKSLFRARHTQPSETANKGLTAFDAVRRANSHLGRFDREETSGGGFSGRRFRRNNAFLLLALRDSSALSSTEVRIAPPSVAPKHLTKAYGRTFLATDQLVRSLASARPDGERPEIKVALHFKRMMPETLDEARWRRAKVYPPAMVLLQKLLEFDRDTASFQDFRVRSYEMQAQSRGSESGSRVRALERVSRLDLASPERGAGPWLIAPYIRLLKGDAELLEQLALPESRAYFPKWSHLYAQRRARPPLGSPELGLTCHAGEDFYTLVDGLWHIEGALSAWRMGPGDALGHCLALGLDPVRQLEALDQIRVPTGIELDSMIWLRWMAKEIGFDNLAVMHKLEHRILDQAAFVYANENATAGKFRIDLATLEAKVAGAAAPLLVPDSYAPSRLPVPIAFADALPDHVSPAESLRLLDFFDPGVARRRQHRKKPTILHRDLSQLLRHTQNALIDQICAKGIVIETNPSSNMRMERIDHPSRLPVCSMLIRDGARPRVTICTDNPGTYDADIETEYALMFSALLTIFGPERRDDAIECLERMRAVGHALFRSL